MGSRGGEGGVLQGLLEHAAREYERVDTEARGPDAVAAETSSPARATAAVLKRSFRPDGSTNSAGAADPEGRSAGGATSNGGDGSSPFCDAGTPSRKRRRVDSGPLSVSASSPSGGARQGLNSHFSEDGGASAGEGYGGETDAAAGKDGEGTNRLGNLFIFLARLHQQRRVCCITAV